MIITERMIVRQQLSRGPDLDDFLHDLQIQCVLKVNPVEQTSRIAQMTQKTNQFNLTTRRYQIPDIQRFLESADHTVILLRDKDRFGSREL